jgi:hypothetical protein
VIEVVIEEARLRQRHRGTDRDKGHKEIQKYRSTETQRHRDTETQRHRDTETHRQGTGGEEEGMMEVRR